MNIEDKIEVWKCTACGKLIEGSVAVVVVMAEHHKCHVQPQPVKKVVVPRRKTEVSIPSSFKHFTGKTSKIQHIYELVKESPNGISTITLAKKLSASRQVMQSLVRRLLRRGLVQRKKLRNRSDRFLTWKYFSMVAAPKTKAVWRKAENQTEAILSAIGNGKATFKEILHETGITTDCLYSDLWRLKKADKIVKEGDQYFLTNKTPLQATIEKQKRSKTGRLSFIEDTLERNKIFASDATKKALMASSDPLKIINIAVANKNSILTTIQVMGIAKKLGMEEPAPKPKIQQQAGLTLPPELTENGINTDGLRGFVSFYSLAKKITARDFVQWLYTTPQELALTTWKIWFVPNAREIIQLALGQVGEITVSDDAVSW